MNHYKNKVCLGLLGVALLVIVALSWRTGSVVLSKAQPARVTEINGLIETRHHAGPMVFSPDGKTLALPKVEGGGVELWSLETGKAQILVSSFNNRRTRANHAAFSKDGLCIAVDNQEEGITIWDLSVKKEMAHIPVAPPSYVQDMAMVEGHRTLMTVMANFANKDVRMDTWNYSAVRWDALTGKMLGTRVFDPYLQFKTISPDGRYSVLQAKGRLGVFELDSGREVFVIDKNGGFRFSEDCSILVSYHGDRVNLWEVPSWKDLAQFALHNDYLPPGYTSYVNCIAISPDKKVLAVGGFMETNAVGLISLESGEVMDVFECGPPSILCDFVCFSPDGRILATSTYADDVLDRRIQPLLKLWRIPKSW